MVEIVGNLVQRRFRTRCSKEGSNIAHGFGDEGLIDVLYLNQQSVG